MLLLTPCFFFSLSLAHNGLSLSLHHIIVFYYADVPYFLQIPPTCWTLGCFQSLLSSTMLQQITFFTWVQSIHKRFLKVTMLGQRTKCIYNFGRYCQFLLHRNCAILHSHQMCACFLKAIYKNTHSWIPPPKFWLSRLEVRPEQAYLKKAPPNAHLWLEPLL